MDLNNVFDQNGNKVPMGWYKFLIYFALFAGGVLNIGTGIMQLTGTIYEMYGVSGVTAGLVYRVYGDGLKFLDIFCGIALIAIGAFAFVVRDKLAKFKPEAPKFITIIYAVTLGVAVFYIVAATAITNVSMIESQITSISMSVVFLCVNINYFKKRAFLFNGNVSVYMPNQTQYTMPVAPQTPVAPQNPVVPQALVAPQNPMQYDEEKTQILMQAPETPVAPIAPVVSETQAAPVRKNNFCTECGAALIPGNKFCSNCGTKVN